ncbi:MAG TPA: DUF3570 domain-containing protein [Polyangiaceae bacterium]|nr:DUF3570 domain-containing protein [Polyangiaceae bacterium]
MLAVSRGAVVAAWLACASFGLPAVARADDAQLSLERFESLGACHVDDAGLVVTTTALAADASLGRTTMSAEVVVDHVREGAAHAHEGDLPSGSVDAITAASSGRGRRSAKTRVFGAVGAAFAEAFGVPALALSSRIGVSAEPGYVAGRAQAAADLTLSSGALLLTTKMGWGHDAASDANASAARDVVDATFALTQLVAAGLGISYGAGLSHVWGNLEMPGAQVSYRSAFVPETLPGDRTRATAFARAAIDLGGAFALHPMVAAYADDWGIAAIAPSLGLARDFGDQVTVLLQYHLYWQTAASFYEVVYLARSAAMTADARLGALLEHRASVGADWRLPGAEPVTLGVTYALADLDHRSMGHETVAHAGFVDLRVEAR